MPAAPHARLRSAAETLAVVSVAERRRVLDEAERLRRERTAGETGLGDLADRQTAARIAELARALSDPVRVQVVEILRRRGGEVCQCDLSPVFDLAQPTLSHHLAKLVAVGLVSVERRGRWAYYSASAESLQDLHAWLSPDEPRRTDA